MIKAIPGILLTMLFLPASTIMAETCPDPQSSTLRYGKIPPPWQVDPMSSNDPQADKNTLFIRANILVATISRGVVCTYRNSIGYYSIWWPVSVKIPARTDYNWIESTMGYVCTISPADCVFYPAIQNQ